MKVDGKLYEIGAVPALNRKVKHEIEAVVDRVVVRDGLGAAAGGQLRDSVGSVGRHRVRRSADSGERTVFSSRFACPVSGFTIEEIEPRLFSFNSPHGACPKCDGLGTQSVFDPQLVIPDERVDPARGGGAVGGGAVALLRPDAAEPDEAPEVSLQTPWKNLPKSAVNAILNGTGESRCVHLQGRRASPTR